MTVIQDTTIDLTAGLTNLSSYLYLKIDGFFVKINEARSEVVMKLTLIVLFSILFSASASARDNYNRYSIEEAMSTSAAKEKLNTGYTFSFGSQSHGPVKTSHGEFTSNKKTNAFGKSEKFACQWAFISAMVSLQARISKEGGNAIINIRSYYKKRDFRSDMEFECGNGSIMAGVTMIGDVVTLE